MILIVSISTFVLIGILLSMLILSAQKFFSGNAPVSIEVNGTEKSAQSGDTLLNVLLAHDINVPSPCGGKATCKQCKVQLQDNSLEPLEPDKATFSVPELRAGWRLSCQCKVRGKVKVKIPESLLQVKNIIGKVISNNNVATYIKELIVEIKEPLEYEPGAYLQFIVPPFSTNTTAWNIDSRFVEEWKKYAMWDRNIKFSPDDTFQRAYSLASYPKEGKILKFNVRIATPPIGKMHKPWGICSSYIFSLTPGAEITLSGPYGESFMKDNAKELIFLIGGAGSSFARSHIMHLFDSKHTERKTTLWYGARSLKENIYQNDFEALDAKYPNFTYKLVLSAPEEADRKAGWPLDDATKTGYVCKAFEVGHLKNLKEPDDCLYYVCGPPLHNSSVLELLDNYGVYSENIVLDDFGN